MDERIICQSFHSMLVGTIAFELALAEIVYTRQVLTGDYEYGILYAKLELIY